MHDYMNNFDSISDFLNKSAISGLTALACLSENIEALSKDDQYFVKKRKLTIRVEEECIEKILIISKLNDFDFYIDQYDSDYLGTARMHAVLSYGINIICFCELRKIGNYIKWTNPRITKLKFKRYDLPGSAVAVLAPSNYSMVNDTSDFSEDDDFNRNEIKRADPLKLIDISSLAICMYGGDNELMSQYCPRLVGQRFNVNYKEMKMALRTKKGLVEKGTCSCNPDFNSPST